MPEFKVGQTVEFTSWGVTKRAVIVRIGTRGGILFLDCNRWMLPQSCTIVA